MIKDRVDYEFHGNKGWCYISDMDKIKTDSQAKDMASYCRMFFHDKTVKAYKVTKHYEEVK